MTDLSDYATNPYRPLELGETGIKVGPNPNPEPAMDSIIRVEFLASDGSKYFHDFTIPRTTYAQRMEVSLMHADGKSLGPIIVTPFAYHEDSKRIHTICRRTIDFDELPPEPQEIQGPADVIDVVEW